MVCMKRPTLAVCLTIYEREEAVLRKMFDSLLPQKFDQLVVVLDRSSAKTDNFVRSYLFKEDRAEIVSIAGKPGWLCPARAWNEAFSRVRTELVYCFSSETVQREGNVAHAAEQLAGVPAILFGKAECGPECPGEVKWTDGAPGSLLCDSKHPRPLGFIWAGPMWAIRAIRGYDENFMRGHWYDDDDFFYRVWSLGIPFVFTDDIYGLHLHHERGELNEDSIRRNLDYYIEKYGKLGATAITPSKTDREPGKTVWRR